MEKGFKIKEDWYLLINHQLRSYFAVCIIMSEARKSKIDMYLSVRKIIVTHLYFRKLCLLNVCQSNRTIFISWKIARFYRQNMKGSACGGFLENQVLRVYTPEENFVINAFLMKFKAGLNYIQHKAVVLFWFLKVNMYFLIFIFVNKLFNTIFSV